MRPERRRNYAGWVVCAVVALAICIAVVLYEKSYADWGLVRMICDGCFVAGVMLAGSGALVWVANFGGFTALGYAWYLLVRNLPFSQEKFEERLSYLEYVQERCEKKKSPVCILATGLGCIAAAGVLLGFCR